MTKKIIGNLDVTNNITVKGNNIARSINDIQADVDGNVDINMFTKFEVDSIIGALPLTRLGTLDYLPLSVSGSYEGATNNHNYKIYPSVMESNGALVFLRPGTDGGTKGYYYSYWSNARESTNVNIVNTTWKYNPSILGSAAANEFIRSDQNVLFAKLTDGVNDPYMLILTNGTMNQAHHTGVKIPTSSLRGTPLYAFMGNTKIYIVCLSNMGGNSLYNGALEFYLYSINTTDVNAGVTTSFVDLTATNWSTTTIFDPFWTGATQTFTSTGIQVAPTTIEYVNNGVPNDNPAFIYCDSSIDRLHSPFLNGEMQGSISAAEDPLNDGKIRISMFGDARFSSTTISAISYDWAFSVDCNVNTKTAKTDQGATSTLDGAFPIAVHETSTAITATSMTGLSRSKVTGLTPLISLESLTQIVLKDGMCFSVGSSSIQHTYYRISRSSIQNYTNKYNDEIIRNRNTATPLINLNVKVINPTYGSAVGQNILAPQPLTRTKMLVDCAGTNNGTYFGKSKVASTFGADGYVYKSLTAGTISGFAPTTNRDYVGSDDKFICPISYVPTLASGNPVQVLGTSFVEDYKLSGFSTMNTTNYSTTGTITIENSLLVSIKNAAITLALGSTVGATIVRSKIVLYQVPSAIFQSIAFIYACSNTTVYSIPVTVDLTTTGSAITAATNIKLIDTFNGGYFTTVQNILSISNINWNTQPGLTIYDADDFVYISIGVPLGISDSSFTFFNMMTICGNINTRQVMTASVTNDYVKMVRSTTLSDQGSGKQFGVVPGVGFGLYDFNTNTDVQTKLIFTPTGTNLNHYLGNTPYVVAPKVVLSQQVAQNWNVYFTQEVPLMMSGNYFKMAPTVIDLTSVVADPSNKTFYISVIMKLGVPRYVISLSFTEDSNTQLAFGNITTNATGIASISTTKVSRLGTYRPATTNYQHAIPVSTGLPTGSGTRWQ
ncbi:Phage minor tail protein [Yersinia phage fHe-Yen9-03]|uniref:Phage minor tail protein n=1 Tax=Yersinia phage fHe-Yen9-03 TaxID=2052743 RepID=A0A2C9CYM7_9CAUD|nr:Phage minor tail protein [Yersinia phage fHe-Yen9-03]